MKKIIALFMAIFVAGAMGTMVYADETEVDSVEETEEIDEAIAETEVDETEIEETEVEETEIEETETIEEDDFKLPTPDEIELIKNMILEQLELVDWDELVGQDATDVAEYVKTKIVPLVVMVISTIAALYVALYPIVNKVKNVTEKVKDSAERFKSSSSDINKVVTGKADSDANIKAKYDELKTSYDELRYEVESIVGDIKNIEQIARIGFGGISELCQNGFAKEIAKVGNDDGNEETKEETGSI